MTEGKYGGQAQLSASALKKNKRQGTWSRMKRSKQVYLMLLPVMAFYILFSYVPMYGIVLAWKDYLPKMP